MKKLIYYFTAFISIFFGTVFFLTNVFFNVEKVWTDHYTNLSQLKFSYILPPVLSALIIYVAVLILKKNKFRFTQAIITIWSIIVGILFTKAPTAGDAGIVIKYAHQFSQNNFEGLSDSYIQNFPFQLGLIGFEEVVFRIIQLPETSVIAIFILINAFMIGGIYTFLYKITNLYFKDQQTLTIFFVIFLGCLQIFIATGYLYGWIPMLFLSSAAMYYLFTNNPWIALLFLSVAYITKPNTLIIFIAILIYLLYNFKVSKKQILILFLFVVVPICASYVPAQIYSIRSGVHLSNGMSKLVWIDMGLTNSVSSYDNPHNLGMLNGNEIDSYGSFNGETYDFSEESKVDITKNNSDTTNSYLQNRINTRLKEFASNPIDAVAFFSNKYLLQWGNSSFSTIQFFRLADYLHPIISTISTVYMQGFNLLISIFYLLALVQIIKRKDDFQYLIIPLIISGTTLYSLISEPREYSGLIMFILMLPYAAAGIKNSTIYLSTNKN
ncbi:MAG: hypothetical protein LBN03_01255 [Bifidobacteriaceae bacterium]|jgi:hypothetical protein|nr:hypothetical protein [Bifidobacteriaceae bacterium]